MALTTPTTPEAWSPNLVALPADDVIPEALILQTSTVSGSIEGDAPSLLVPFVDDAEATFVAEGELIPEATPGPGAVAVFTGKVAQIVHLSREQLAQPNASRLITNSMKRAVTTKANLAYVAQPAPVSPAVTPPAGLLNTAVTDGGAVAGDLDALVDAVAGIEAEGGQATHILASPTAWASLSKFKAATDSAMALLGAGTAAGERQILGIPVVVTAAMPTDDLLIIDKSAVASAVGQVQLATSEHAFFASDRVAVRVTWRFGAAVVRPARLARLTVTAPL